MKKETTKKLQEDTLFNNAGNRNYTDPESTEDVIRYVTRTNKQSKKDSQKIRNHVYYRIMSKNDSRRGKSHDKYLQN